MIVECSNCQTRFQLDESRVPARGIRVRCSRCKEAFFLQNPNASQSEAVDDVAEQAISAAPPEPTQDLPPEPAPDLGDAEEEDWEFNQDLPDEDPNDASRTQQLDTSDSGSFELDIEDPEEAALGETRAEPVPGLGIDDGFVGSDDEADEGSGLDLAGDSDPGETVVREREKDVGFDADEEASDFGEASDFSALADDSIDTPVVEVSEANPESALPASAPDPVAAEDVGEPEDWDFFSDESLEAPSSMEPVDHAMGRAMAAIEADTLTQSAPAPEIRSHYSESRGLMGGLRGAGRMLGWLVTLTLFGAGIARGVFHVDAPSAQVPPVVDFGNVQAQDIRATWLETSRSTRLYAVEGRLVNDGARAVVAGGGTQVALMTLQGDRLELPAARAGLPLSESQLRELPPRGLREAAESSAARLASTRLEPGRAVDFQAFFDRVPDEAALFLVEMVEPARTAPAAAPDPEAFGEREAGASPEAATTTPSSGPGAAPEPSSPTGLP